ncbi:MAG: hypothetical protein HYX65_04500 [Gemmatimonadetes bacterium]|nr:hypothetical protein [Gemmatimonadota bacterium]
MNIRFVHLYQRVAKARDRSHDSRELRAMMPGRLARRRSRRRRALLSVALATALIVAGSCQLHAQQWRSVDVARQQHDTLPVAVKVRFTTGRLALGTVPAPYLYRMQLRYDAARGEPRTAWDPVSRTATLGVSTGSASWSGGRGREAGTMTLGLSRTAPIDLSIEVGATESTLDFSGLWLNTLSIRSGASETIVRFSSPNAHAVDRVDVETGAARFAAQQLANSGARHVTVRGGLSLVELDLTGTWRRDMTVDLDLAMGKGELTVPAAVGVRVTTEGSTMSSPVEGLKKVGNAWESDGFASAERKLIVTSRTTIGGLSVRRQ